MPACFAASRIPYSCQEPTIQAGTRVTSGTTRLRRRPGLEGRKRKGRLLVRLPGHWWIRAPGPQRAGCTPLLRPMGASGSSEARPVHLVLATSLRIVQVINREPSPSLGTCGISKTRLSYQYHYQSLSSRRGRIFDKPGLDRGGGDGVAVPTVWPRLGHGAEPLLDLRRRPVEFEGPEFAGFLVRQGTTSVSTASMTFGTSLQMPTAHGVLSFVV